jgi:hypothetical protein
VIIVENKGLLVCVFRAVFSASDLRNYEWSDSWKLSARFSDCEKTCQVMFITVSI